MKVVTMLLLLLMITACSDNEIEPEESHLVEQFNVVGAEEELCNAWVGNWEVTLIDKYSPVIYFWFQKDNMFNQKTSIRQVKWIFQCLPPPNNEMYSQIYIQYTPLYALLHESFIEIIGSYQNKDKNASIFDVHFINIDTYNHNGDKVAEKYINIDKIKELLTMQKNWVYRLDNPCMGVSIVGDFVFSPK